VGACAWGLQFSGVLRHAPYARLTRRAKIAFWRRTTNFMMLYGHFCRDAA
jgi:hypothetical protein